MSKILAVLLIMLLLVTSSMFITAGATDESPTGDEDTESPEEPSEEGTGDTMEPINLVTNDNMNPQETVTQSVYISDLKANQEIIYGWSVIPVLVRDQQEPNTEGKVLFQTEVVRYQASHQLNMFIEAEINEEIAIDSMIIELGYVTEDGFEVIKALETEAVQQNIVEGKTLIILDVALDLQDLDKSQLSLIQAMRLSIPEEEKQGTELTWTGTHEFLFPEETHLVHAEARMETNLLEAIGAMDLALEDMGDSLIATVVEDDWEITEDKLDENGCFQKEIQIFFDEVKDIQDIRIEVVLKGDGDEIIYATEAAMTVEETGLLQNIWSGDVHHVHGFWIPPIMDDFYLDRRVVPIKFWLEETSPEPLSLSFFEANLDNLGNVTLGNPVYRIPENEFRTGIRGRRTKTLGGNIPGDYYRINLKGRNIPSLKSGNTYVLAVMVGQELLVYNEETPAILTFTVSNDGTLAKRITQIKLNRCGFDNQPRYNSYNMAK